MDFRPVDNAANLMPQPEFGAASEVFGGDPGAGPTPDEVFGKLLVIGSGPTLPGEAPLSGFRTRSVVGLDERVRVLTTNAPPWRMICSLLIQGPGISVVGTGAVIGPRTILTAGHCVHHNTFGGWATKITVIPGRDRANFPFGTQVARRFASLDIWTATMNPDYDVGCIHLDAPLDPAIGSFALGSLPDDRLQNAFLNISGYPADRGMGEEQYFHADRAAAVTPQRVFYAIDTYGGQSGAPVWIYPDGDTSRPVQVAVHAYGVGATGTNSGPRITPALLDQIKTWLAEDGSPAGA